MPRSATPLRLLRADRMIGKLALAAAALGGLYAAMPRRAPARAVKVHPVPLDLARSRLAAAERRVDGTGLGSLTISSDGFGGATQAIHVVRAGDTRGATCRVALHAAAPPGGAAPRPAMGTRADIDCLQTSVASPAARRAGVEILDPIVREHVGAAIEARPYRIDEVADRVMVAGLRNAPLLTRTDARNR